MLFRVIRKLRYSAGLLLCLQQCCISSPAAGFFSALVWSCEIYAVLSPALLQCHMSPVASCMWSCQVDMGDSALTYIPGDALGILPTNCAQVHVLF